MVNHKELLKEGLIIEIKRKTFRPNLYVLLNSIFHYLAQKSTTQLFVYLGASAAILVLPGADRYSDVAPQQQLAVPQLSSQPSARVFGSGPLCQSLHGRPSTVPLHQGRLRSLSLLMCGFERICNFRLCRNITLRVVDAV